MAEGRMLKRKISVSEQVADLESDTHRLLFTWGISHLDAEGRMTGNPRKIKALVCPMLDHISSDGIKGYLSDIQAKGLVLVYESNGEWWQQYPTFDNHQNIRKDRESKSLIPEPTENVWTTPGALRDNSGSTPPKVKISKVKISQVKSSQDNTPAKNAEVQNDDFENFWKEYPRREGKTSALKAWNSKIKSGIDPSDLIKAASNYHDQCIDMDKERKYIKLPATFLNGDWDELLNYESPLPTHDQYGFPISAATEAQNAAFEDEFMKDPKNRAMTEARDAKIITERAKKEVGK